MKASIIVPVFNSQESIGKCLDSLLNQKTVFDYEIIVVDDGSKDATKKILMQYEKKDKIKAFFLNNKGPASARNFGVKKAVGEIVVFVDSDCEAKQDWLNEMIKPFSDPRVVGCQGAYKTKQKSLIARFVQIEIENRYKKMMNSKKLDWIGSYSAAYKKSIFEEVKGFDSNYLTASGEDPDLSYTLSENNKKLVFNPKAIVYHKHVENLLGYLKKKFVHSYWRVRLYSKHKKKIISDSYTPQALKLQLFSFALFFFGFTLSFFLENSVLGLLALFSLIIFAFSSLPFVFYAFSKDFFVGLIAFPLIFLRTIAFMLGIFQGVLHGLWE